MTGDVGFTNGITTDNADFDSGFTIGGSVGYRWSNIGFGGIFPRTEIELNYAENEVDTLDFSGNGVGNETVVSDSNVSSVSILANLYFDMPDALGSGITPYFGGGIGVAFVNHDIIYNAPGANLSDTDSAFTWHLTAGASINVTESAALFADVGYHQIVDAGSIRRIGAN
ncbi:MAG: outer membrane protein, partial [Hyphomicrobiaceae bacterium]